MSSTRKEKLVRLLYCDQCQLSKETFCIRKYDCGDTKYNCIRCTEHSMCDRCVLCRPCTLKYKECKRCGKPLIFSSNNNSKEIVTVLGEIKTALEDIHGFFVHAAVGDQLASNLI